jgi:hypothetical protein
MHMNLTEIVPAHGYEHRREIRRMARDVTGPSPVWGALGEITALVLAFAVIFGTAWLFFSWWLCL